MSIEFRRMIRARRHAALETRAKEKRSTGGKAFGYSGGTIDEAEARIVREIFELAADGASDKHIAARLNARHVPSPGSSWNRTRRRGAGWMNSAIRVILRNERYRGVVHWNVSEWRKDPDTGKRRRVMRPRSEWVSRTDESQRIVSDGLWRRVKERQTQQTHRIEAGVRRGLTKHAAIASGTGNRYLLSGLLRCASCGGSYVICAPERYGCAAHNSGGNALCANNATFRRQRAERAVLSGLKAVLSSPEFIQEIVAEIREMRRIKHATTKDTSERIRELTERRDNLVEAIATRGLSASPGLAQGLERAEEELARLKAEQSRPTVCEANVVRLQGDLPTRAARAIDTLEDRLERGDIPVAREELKHHVGTVTVEADEREVRLYGEGVAAALARAAGFPSTKSVGSGGTLTLIPTYRRLSLAA